MTQRKPSRHRSAQRRSSKRADDALARSFLSLLWKTGATFPKVSVPQLIRENPMILKRLANSVTITAAAHLSPMVDFADLDGNLLISNDPFRAVRVEKGKLILPSKPGLGLTPA
jgi:hypothetical protein